MQKSIEFVANIGLDHALVKTALDLAQQLYDSVPLQGLEFAQSPSVPTDFEYKITAIDGRVWTQNVTFAAWPTQDIDPPMTFDVPDGWRRVAEFSHHRDLRTHLIAMVNNAGMTRLEIVWSDQ